MPHLNMQEKLTHRHPVQSQPQKTTHIWNQIGRSTHCAEKKHPPLQNTQSKKDQHRQQLNVLTPPFKRSTLC